MLIMEPILSPCYKHNCSCLVIVSLKLYSTYYSSFIIIQNFASDELNFSLAEGHLKAVFVNPNTLIWIRIQDFGLILMKIQGYAINFEREKL